MRLTATLLRRAGATIVLATQAVFAKPGLAIAVAATGPAITWTDIAVFAKPGLAIAVAATNPAITRTTLAVLIGGTLTIATRRLDLTVATVLRRAGTQSIPLIVATEGIVRADNSLATLVVTPRRSIGGTAVASA